MLTPIHIISGNGYGKKYCVSDDPWKNMVSQKKLGSFLLKITQSGHFYWKFSRANNDQILDC